MKKLYSVFSDLGFFGHGVIVDYPYYENKYNAGFLTIYETVKEQSESLSIPTKEAKQLFEKQINENEIIETLLRKIIDDYDNLKTKMNYRWTIEDKDD